MPITVPPPPMRTNAPIPTWFGVGGGADLLARPESLDQLCACLESDRRAKVLGDGANLLVADAGVRGMVVSLDHECFSAWHQTAQSPTHVTIRAGAGVRLPRLITETVRAGLGGLEGLAGVPASVGGAVMMNAGGAMGQTGDAVSAVGVLTRDGATHTLLRNTIAFEYRRTTLFADPRRPAPAPELGPPVVLWAEFKLKKTDAGTLRQRLKRVMAAKAATQPMGERSAGCAFKNPVLRADLPGMGVAGSTLSAGMLIDRAGCKGLRVGGAEVSARHANFVTAQPGALAADVIELLRQVRQRVDGAFGVRLEPEVVIWGDAL
ncbi:MAG: UDP-N-acetylenolpyruvoylglucosamine reductase [Planctomyces sp.]|nr:UDP-N-acetylenolpyruvoylglucosamine reductase [Planctomyces sp.]MBA4039685.1 UDP-N-acetylenolpyruvoylglucosamine reductase [Planctomyces sp.]